MIGGDIGEIHPWDDHPEGSGGSQLEFVNGEVVGPQVRTVRVEDPRLKEGRGEEPLETVVNLSCYRHPVGVWGDPDISDQELLAYVDKILATERILR